MRARSSTFSSKWRSAWQIAAMALFALLLLPVGRAAGAAIEESAGKNKINAWSKARFDDFYALEPYTLDMAFLGSSHAYCTFDPEKIDAALGVNSYQLGMPQQLPDATFYTLREVLRTQRPGTVVMELYWGVLDADFEVKQADLFFQVLQNEETIAEYKENVFPMNEKVKYAIKPIRFQQDYFAYATSVLLKRLEDERGLKPTIKQFEGEEYYRSKGYIYCDYVMSDDEYARIAAGPGSDGKKWKMSGLQREYVGKIAGLCAEERIELVFVTAPVSNVSFRGIRGYDNIHRQIAELAEELGAAYLDFNLANEGGRLFADEHFRDGGHLNDAGTEIADAYFAEWYTNVKKETVS